MDQEEGRKMFVPSTIHRIGFTVSPCPCRGRVEKNFKRKGPTGLYTTLNGGILWRYNRQMCMASNYNGLQPMGSF